MTQDAHDQLIASLEVVRKAFDAKADDWQFSLLRTLREYLRAIGVERRLIDPVQAFLLQQTDDISLERRRAAGRTGTPVPIGASGAMAYAAAAVTSLKVRHGIRLPIALASVTKAAGMDKKALKDFRENISRKRVAAGALTAHDIAMTEMQEYSADDILTAVTGIGKFVE
ncbi:hypothetical protein [Rhizobium ruizarguesonis]|uniref:hypothetical protein n=1 Tax=Rhizobium ruizarguesonis TaxID=2081791 RepID=UPI001031EE5B|nr:hypothetical protein [Rhizobium ruizarguesonis]TBB88095.1 hypothetical protein ELH41_15265 [Rhizobium ruizarguesonis]TBC45056.1 hypothetical protein ELH31_15425 [Rhizobium ruizarguesonis]